VKIYYLFQFLIEKMFGLGYWPNNIVKQGILSVPGIAGYK